MGKKGLTSIFSKLPAGADEPSPPWPWPSCRNPQTASFREEERRRPCRTAAAVSRSPAAAARLIHGGAGEMYKTVNSVYQLDYISADGSCFDDEEEEEEGQGVLELDDDDGFSTTTASEEWSEAVIRSLGRTSTDRFFVDPPGPASNSILALSPGKQSAAQADEAEEKPQSEPIASTSLVEESVAVAVDSEDPYGDFRASMEEMVAAHGLRGWEALEELLVWSVVPPDQRQAQPRTHRRRLRRPPGRPRRAAGVVLFCRANHHHHSDDDDDHQRQRRQREHRQHQHVQQHMWLRRRRHSRHHNDRGAMRRSERRRLALACFIKP
ncbi:hypothetical protein VPH35_066526 [Triticum aestivum]